MLRRIAPVIVASLCLGGFVAWRATDARDASASQPASAAQAGTPATPAGDTQEVRDPKRLLALAKPTAPGARPQAVDALIEQTQKSLARNPKKVDFWVLLGRAWVRKAREQSDPGYYLNADAAADLALDLTPDNSAALDVKALVLLNDHKFAEARALASRTVDKNPDDPTAYGNLADAWLELGRYDEAKSTTQKMMDLKPNLPSYSRMAHLAWLHGDTKGARESLRLALDSGKDTRDKEPYAWVLTQAAQQFMEQGDLEGAEAGFDKALDWFSGFAPANVGKARLAAMRGDMRRAKELYQRAFDASPLVETAWRLGDACKEVGDDACATKAHAYVRTEGRRTDPRTFAMFLAKRNETPELALSLAQVEMKVRPDIYTEEVLALAASRAGKHDEAVRAIHHARRLGTKEAHFAFHEGLILHAKGDKAGAAKAFAEALQMNPNFEGSALAKSLLES
jgi:tetratricopeptide (TPR) repeat protein